MLYGDLDAAQSIAGKYLHQQKEASLALVAALLDACKLCQEPSFQDEMISILALKK
jgi:hypothetical protein